MPEPFDLNLRHLRAMPIIARRGSINAAAEAANLSQPALTQGLAKIEAQLGAALFVRRPDGMTLSTEGAVMVQRIEVALMHLALGARPGAGGRRGFARPDQLMTATQARAFLALADASSFAEAARVTGWSQPALHRAVRDLEQISAAPLLERRGRAVILTPAGRRLARGIRLAAVELAAGIGETRPDASLDGRIVIGAMPLARAQLLPAAIAKLIHETEGATVDVVEGSWRELIEPLRDGIVDLMVGALRPDPLPGFIQVPLSRDYLAVVGRAGHPLAGTAESSLDELARFPWIVGSDRSPLRHRWDELFVGRTMRAPIECGSVMTIRGILLDSDCLTLLSPEQIAMELKTGMLATIGPPRADMVRTIGVTTRAGSRPPALHARFLDLLHEASFRKLDKA